MEPESFFHVAIKADNLDASESFYRDHFDGEVIERGDADDAATATAVNYVTLDVADKLVYIFDEAPYEAAGLVDSVPTGLLHFGYVVSDIDAAHREIASAGIDFIMEPTVFGDLKVAFCTDPSGVRVELIEHL